MEYPTTLNLNFDVKNEVDKKFILPQCDDFGGGMRSQKILGLLTDLGIKCPVNQSTATTFE